MFRLYGWEASTGLNLRPWGPSRRGCHRWWPASSSCRRSRFLWDSTALRGSIRLALIDENNTPESVGGSLWVIWLAAAALTPAFWPGGPRAVDRPVLARAAQPCWPRSTVADLVNRRVPVRTLISLAPATAMSVAWWASEDLRGAVDDLVHGRARRRHRPGPAPGDRPDPGVDLVHPEARSLGSPPRRPPAPCPGVLPARCPGDHGRHGGSGSCLPPQRDSRPLDAPHHDLAGAIANARSTSWPWSGPIRARPCLRSAAPPDRRSQEHSTPGAGCGSSSARRFPIFPSAT